MVSLSPRLREKKIVGIGRLLIPPAPFLVSWYLGL